MARRRNRRWIQQDSSKDWKPTPDPTALTTQALDNAVIDLKELFRDGLASLDRLNAEKFSSFAKELASAKEAVAAQNTSSSSAILKSEASTEKQIDQQAQLIMTTGNALKAQLDTTTGALRGQIDDLKERLTRAEGSGAGKASARDDLQANSHLIIAIIGIVTGTIIGGIGLIVAFWPK